MQRLMLCQDAQFVPVDNFLRSTASASIAFQGWRKDGAITFTQATFAVNDVFLWQNEKKDCFLWINRRAV